MLKGESTTDPVESTSTTQLPPPDPKTCTIEPGKEVQIEIEKGTSGLGLSIVGGADTLLVSTVCIVRLQEHLLLFRIFR